MGAHLIQSQNTDKGVHQSQEVGAFDWANREKNSRAASSSLNRYEEGADQGYKWCLHKNRIEKVWKLASYSLVVWREWGQAT